MKTIKIFEGVNVITNKGNYNLQDMKFLELFSDEIGKELIRSLICNFQIVLSSVCENCDLLILRLITQKDVTENDFKWNKLDEVIL